MSDDEKLFATVAVEVQVYLGAEPGINNSSAYELPYEYLVIREAEMTSVKFCGNPAAGILAEDPEDFDPDDALVYAVKSALIPAIHEEGEEVGCNICGRPIPAAEPHICLATDREDGSAS